jgi:hypothetical protein
VTVEDPNVLVQPWELTPMLMTLITPAPPAPAGGGAPGAGAPGGGAPGGGGGGGGGGGFGAGGLVGTERGHCQQLELDDISNQIRH